MKQLYCNKIITKYLKLLYLLIGLGVSIKRIFIDYGIDVEYAIATSYRQLSVAGVDLMFTEMWEPHQTSAFLTTFLIYIYELLFHTNTGIVLYLQICEVLIHGGVIFAFYTVLKKWIQPTLLLPLCTILFIYRPKNLSFPEFSNMQIWFSILTFVFIIKFWESKEHNKLYLFLISVCICLEVLSYPSCVILFLGVLIVFKLYFINWKSHIIVTTFNCGLLGILYLFIFIRRMGITGLFNSLLSIVNSDSAHETKARFINMFRFIDYRAMVIIYIAAFVLSLIRIRILYKNVLKKQITTSKYMFIVGLWTCIGSLFGTILLFVINRGLVINNYGVCFIIIIFMGMSGLKYCSLEEKMLVTISYIFSLCSFIGTLLLTNLNWLVTLFYMILAFAMSFIAIIRKLQYFKLEYHYVMPAFCTLLGLICIIIPINISGLYVTTLDLRGILKSGPAVGIFTDYIGAEIYNTSIEEWNNYIDENEKILIVSEGRVSTIGYLFQNSQVAACSTISTANFDEVLFQYWKNNPHKVPDVIVMSCWDGELKVNENNVLFDWMESEGRSYTYQDGEYWRYYRIEYTQY